MLPSVKLSMVVFVAVTSFPFQLSAAYGQGAGPADCDRFASMPSDPNANAIGVKILDIDPERARRACENAMNDHPGEPRFKFQLARVYLSIKQYGKARKLAEEAIADGYGIANVTLAYLAATGNDGPKDEDKATRFIVRAAEAGLPLAAYV